MAKAMRWADGFIAVDWGTTNRRAYRLDGNGECVSSYEDGRGILSVEPHQFPAATSEVRDRLGNLPLLLCGMVGSNRGWVEAPYVACPAGPRELAARIRWVEPNSIAIVPGLSVVDQGRADVMRGEEIQLVGALASGMISKNCFVGHPGTHNKWVIVEDGRITNFRTVMTGELFAMLRERGMLAEALAGEARLGDAFGDGVRQGLDGSVLTAELFSVRAAVLLGSMSRETAPSFVSGLLIGTDIRVGVELAGEAEMIIMGDPELTRLYAAAAELADRKSRQIDGEAAFLAGAALIARLLG